VDDPPGHAGQQLQRSVDRRGNLGRRAHREPRRLAQHPQRLQRQPSASRASRPRNRAESRKLDVAPDMRAAIGPGSRRTSTLAATATTSARSAARPALRAAAIAART
jgi:hypothetical protein